MRALARIFVPGLGLAFRTRTSLQLENLALPHQLTIYQRSRATPRIQPVDRLFWAWLSRVWSGWRGALMFVQPRTIIAWQRKRLTDHWARLSGKTKPDRPSTSPRYLLRDRDSIYGAYFRKRVKNMGIEEVLIAPRTPWPTPFVERVIGGIRRDCLDHVIVLSQDHLRRILRSYFGYYHDWRTHLSLDMDCPEPRAVQPAEAGEIVEVPEVGGLHHHYERRAA